MREKGSVLKKMSLGDVLDYSIELYKRNFNQLTLLTLVCYLPIALLTAFISANLLAEQVGVFRDLFQNIGNPDYSPDTFSEPNMGTGYIVYTMLSYLVQFFALVFSFTVQLAMEGAIIKITYADALYGVNEKAFPSLKASFKKLGHLVLNKLVYWIIVGGVYFVSIIIMLIVVFAVTFGLAAGFRGASDFPVALIVVLVVLGLIMFLGMLFAMVFFAFRLIFGKHIIVIENTDFGKGLSRSWKLSKGNFWHIALSLVFGGILLYFIPVIVTASSFALGAIGKGVFVIGFVASQLLSSIIYPYIWVLMTVLFINLKIKKEGLDLELEVDKLLKDREARQIKLENGEATDV